MLAKITSELGKPAGLVVLSRERGAGALRRRLPGLVPGIGPKTVARLEQMGIRTLAELRGLRSAAELEERFGPRSGAWLHARGRLRDETPVVARTRDQVAVGRDHLRRRRRPSAASSSATWRALRGALPAPAQARAARAARSGSRSGSTTGPTSPARTRSTAPTNDPAVVGPSRSTCCAPTTRSGRCGCSASASPPSSRRRGRRRSAGRRRAGPQHASSASPASR